MLKKTAPLEYRSLKDSKQYLYEYNGKIICLKSFLLCIVGMDYRPVSKFFNQQVRKECVIILKVW